MTDSDEPIVFKIIDGHLAHESKTAGPLTLEQAQIVAICDLRGAMDEIAQAIYHIADVSN